MSMSHRKLVVDHRSGLFIDRIVQVTINSEWTKIGLIIRLVKPNVPANHYLVKII